MQTWFTARAVPHCLGAVARAPYRRFACLEALERSSDRQAPILSHWRQGIHPDRGDRGQLGIPGFEVHHSAGSGCPQVIEKLGSHFIAECVNEEYGDLLA